MKTAQTKHEESGCTDYLQHDWQSCPENKPAPNKAQHSPLPWQSGRGGDNTIRIYSRGKPTHLNVVAQLGEGIDEDWREHKHASANAALIVRAVNHADKLAEALRDLRAAIKLGTLNVRKDFSLMVAHASATKALVAWEGAQQ